MTTSTWKNLPIIHQPIYLATNIMQDGEVKFKDNKVVFNDVAFVNDYINNLTEKYAIKHNFIYKVETSSDKVSFEPFYKSRIDRTIVYLEKQPIEALPGLFTPKRSTELKIANIEQLLKLGFWKSSKTIKFWLQPRLTINEQKEIKITFNCVQIVFET